MKIVITLPDDQSSDIVVDVESTEPTPRAPFDLAAAQRDVEDKVYAARYRYIRNGHYTPEEEQHWNKGAVGYGACLYIGDELDARVDAARFGEIPS